jgi:type II secretory pathway pseudopilin PulG
MNTLIAILAVIAVLGIVFLVVSAYASSRIYNDEGGL